MCETCVQKYEAIAEESFYQNQIKLREVLGQFIKDNDELLMSAMTELDDESKEYFNENDPHDRAQAHKDTMITVLSSMCHDHLPDYKNIPDALAMRHYLHTSVSLGLYIAHVEAGTKDYASKNAVS